MPIRIADERRCVEMTFVVPEVPEPVWRAIATGNGNCAWFTTASIEERVGGSLTFDFDANGIASGEVTAWSPPTHFAYIERDWLPGAPPIATDITIEPRIGRQSLVRMTHTIETTANTWDAHLEEFEAVWPVYFEVLRIYLTHFPDLSAACFQARHAVRDTPLAVWTRLTTALHLGGAHVGDQALVAPQPQPWIGVVAHMVQSPSQRFVIMRLETPAPGIALIGASVAPGSSEGETPLVNASVSAHFYGETAVGLARHSEHSLREWLPQLFAASTTPSGV